MFDHSLEEDWYKYLAQKMRGGTNTLEAFADNAVQFINFNYDRSLEQYLFTTLKSFWGADDATTARVIGRVPIHYVHGRVGYLPWQGKQMAITRAYDNNGNRAMVAAAVATLNIVHEDMTDALKNQLRASVHWAERIYFIGFGYLRANMLKLGFDGKKYTGKEIKGTTHGLEALEVAVLNTKFNLDLPRDQHMHKSLTWLRKFTMLDANR